jgi:hypothetical protein
MKRLLLFLSFFIPFSLFAQTTITFDTLGQSWVPGVFGGSPDPVYSVVANPSVGGINTSATCGQLVIEATAQHWAGAFFTELPDFTLDASNCIVKVMVYKDVISPFNLKLEGPNIDQRNVSNTLINQWEELTFDYSPHIGTAVATLTIIPDHEPDSTGRTHASTNYFDNFSFNAIIPVELTSFTGSYVGQTVNLNWTTATEVNNNGFEIQRSSEVGNFVTVGFVEGKGTSTETTNYSFVDKNISSRTEYSYRLKQIDFDGHYSFSDIINLGASLPVSLVLDQNYPNPFNPVTNISFALPGKSNVSLEIYNLVGQKVMTLVQGSLEEGTYNYSVDASNLSSGIYIYSLSTISDNGISSVISKKMTLLK